MSRNSLLETGALEKLIFHLHKSKYNDSEEFSISLLMRSDLRS